MNVHGSVRRIGWRDALRPAAFPTIAGFSLVGPSGPVAGRIVAAATPRERARGLRGRDTMSSDEALILEPCRQVHTFGMRFAIDAVFCDRDLVVVAVQSLDPGRLSRPARRARVCVELPAGRAAECGLTPGVQLRLAPAGDAGAP